jgi:hypothetical protein
MLREIVKSSDKSYTLILPDEMVGKTIEVIAFEIQETLSTADSVPVNTLESISKKYGSYPIISHADYQFDRDEANDYTE